MQDIEPDLDLLRHQAVQACACAYAPYSGFRVGAAVVDSAGRIFSGCNVENASYGVTSCAERNAIAAAIAAGAGPLMMVLIYTPGERAHPPCGACRQVIEELLDPDALIIACCDSEQHRSWTVRDVLPDPFEFPIED